MSLDLDARQRAMLQEMRVRVWWPLPAAPVPPAPMAVAAVRATTAAPPRTDAVPGPATARVEAPAARLEVFGTQHAAPVPGMDMATLAAAIAACDACRLCEGRKVAVFDPALAVRQADWMVVGDPPTEDEERAGTAFAGQAGELLDNMLRAVRRTRNGAGPSGAWLTHVVKCRPAVVRNPEPDELARCAMYLRQEVALVQPRVILAMGRFAALSLLVATDPDIARVPFAKLRGRLHHFEGVPVVVTYSPARLLRAQEDKAGAWADLCLAQAAVQPAPGANGTPS